MAIFWFKSKKKDLMTMPLIKVSALRKRQVRSLKKDGFWERYIDGERWLVNPNFSGRRSLR